MIRRICNSIRIRISRVIVPFLLRFGGVTVGKSTTLIGVPIITLFKGSSVEIGNRVSIISKSWATALGVNHPTVLRTLQADASIVIGEGSGISGGTFCVSKLLRIGCNCLIGANVTIVDTDFHNLDPDLRHTTDACHKDARPVSIGNNVFLGTGSTVLKGVDIGDNSVIGAGSVVSKSIPSNVIAAGNPCQIIRGLDS